MAAEKNDRQGNDMRQESQKEKSLSVEASLINAQRPLFDMLDACLHIIKHLRL